MRYVRQILNISFLLFTACSSIVGQEFEEYKWHEYVPISSIPDSLKESDAIMLLNQRTVINEIEGIPRWSVYQKIKILTKKGIEDYAKIFVSKYEGTDIVVLDARTIKPNGEIVDLNKADIKKLDFESDFSEEGIEELRFMVPGVEVGDVIEVVYQVNEMTWGDDFFFHSYLPTVVSKLTVVNHNRLFTDIQVFNGLTDPKVEKKGETVEYTWMLKNLPSIEDEYGAILYNELPYVSIVLRGLRTSGVPGVEGTVHTLQSKEWGSVYDNFLDAIENKLSPRSEAKNAYKDLLGVIDLNEYPTQLEKVYKVFSKIHDEIEVIEYHKEKTKTALENSIYDGEIDEMNLMFLYYKVLSSLDVDFSLGVAKSRYKGTFDSKEAAVYNASNYFFSFVDGNGVYHFIYPSSNKKKYKFDELPPSIEGTNAILINKKRRNALDSKIEILELPKSTEENNKRNIQSKVSFEGDKVSINYRESLSGAYSTLERHYYYSDKEIDEFIFDEDEQLDTSYITEEGPFYPYDFVVVSELSAPSPMVMVNDTLMTVPIGYFLEDNTIKLGDSRRLLDYYPHFRRTENQKYYLQFDFPVRLANANDLSASISNNHGSADIVIKQINPQIVLLSSNYTVKSAYIPKSEVETLKELNDLIQETIGLDLVLIKE